MNIFSIETSCDETGAAVLEFKNGHIKILSNVIGSQISTHKRFGGVVPELAARRHAEIIIPVIDKALHCAFGKSDGLNFNKIDAIAVTCKPGLMTALLVGVETAKALSYALDKPIVGVNHLEGHIYSVLLDKSNFNKVNKIFNSRVLSLIVSGGHTQLVLIEGYRNFKLVGETRDDAAGEAFDKIARMLGLSYPGGPSISRIAKDGNKNRFDMPRSMLRSDDFDFSFSGLKTHVMYLIKDLKKKGEDEFIKSIPDISASFEDAVSDILMAKTIGAALYYKVKNIIITGGVSANTALREKIKKACAIENLNCYFPPLNLTGDNAAMIALAGYFKIRYSGYDDIFKIKASPKSKWR